MEIRKKILKKFFDKVLDGSKNWEFRLNDFEINEGDTLILVELDNETRQPTGRTLSKTVNDVTKFNPFDFYSVEEVKNKGVQIISFK